MNVLRLSHAEEKIIIFSMPVVHMYGRDKHRRKIPATSSAACSHVVYILRLKDCQMCLVAR